MNSNFSLDVEDLDKAADAGAAAGIGQEDYNEPYMGEPLAGKEWLANSNEERQAEQQLDKGLERRLNGAETLNEW